MRILYNLLTLFLSWTMFVLAIQAIAPGIPWKQALAFALFTQLGARFAAELEIEGNKK